MQGFYENHRDNMPSAHAWYKENDHFMPHFHSSVELVYVLSGELKATIDGAALIASENMMVISSSYAVHSYETPERSLAVFATIPLTDVPDIARKLQRQSFAETLVRDDDQRTLRELMCMLERFQRSPVTMKGLCGAILGLLIDRVGLLPAREGSRTLFIRDVLEHVSQHHAEAMTVQRLADRFGYSRSHFSHLFSTHLGCSVADYVASVRCVHAAQLLRETDMRVADAALAVGFESLRTFYRTFKKQYKMTPNAYARD